MVRKNWLIFNPVWISDAQERRAEPVAPQHLGRSYRNGIVPSWQIENDKNIIIFSSIKSIVIIEGEERES
jgi:hypothetical protein